MNSLSKSLLLAALPGLLTVSCVTRIGSGETPHGSLAVVNAGINIANECTITAESRTVNGSITVVEGEIINEDDRCEVHVIIADGAKLTCRIPATHSLQYKKPFINSKKIAPTHG